MQNLLEAMTQQMTCDQESIDVVLRRYEGHRDNIAPYAQLIHQLHEVLIPQQPTTAFTRELKRELMGKQSSTFSLSGFPIRAQIAAVAAIIAGFLLLLRRRSAEELPESLDTPALQIFSKS